MTRMPITPIFPVAQFLTYSQRSLFGALNTEEKQQFQQRFYEMLGVSFHHSRTDEQPSLRFPDKTIHLLLDSRDRNLTTQEKKQVSQLLCTLSRQWDGEGKCYITVWQKTGFPLAGIVRHMQLVGTLTDG